MSDDGGGDGGRRDGRVRYDQARYVEDGQYEPLLSEKDLTRVGIGDEADGNADEHDRRDGEDGERIASPLPDDLTRDALELPDLSEPELARHYTRLSQMTYGIESGPYPLGSCTMKYNPKFTEDVAALTSASIHPDRSERSVQGTLELTYRLQDYLGRIGGMDAVTLQPPAGAAGEFVGIRVAAAYHEHNGEGHRDEVIVPESAHGTNFATAALGGYDVVSLPSDDAGRVDLEALEAALSERTAALMLTNPNTLGLFERDIEEIADMVHDVGGLLYYDGANLNALLGRARPGDMGFDVMHYNVHKTFATPHGGGGPGAGPVGVVDELAPFLPAPRVRRRGNASEQSHERDTNPGAEDGASASERPYELFEPDHTIGKVHGFQGNWLVLVKTFAYIARLGDEGLDDASAMAVLNANYLAEQIEYEVPYEPFHHEFVASAGDQDAADVAKRMLDYGVHPPTTKWPEIVPEALMTEPTEIESRDTLDRLAAAFDAVAAEDDETVAGAPERSTARRIDQTGAARNPQLSWQALEDE